MPPELEGPVSGRKEQDIEGKLAAAKSDFEVKQRQLILNIFKGGPADAEAFCRKLGHNTHHSFAGKRATSLQAHDTRLDPEVCG